ncbi:polysaccharide lyase family 8 super-sandwich domain-containing protein [Paenibacillus silviterrae]|uniref:polysaccharide lyase family 8 super-sandwich domain-containing protein n=1 Tax=Paenibacillus silviterrae TaxID=3242194 RepID=UPI002542DD97|nr:polysaccharide lyase family 8 super-sandwich domain-containing protein [Paenibacillus chinjuensis]
MNRSMKRILAGWMAMVMIISTLIPVMGEESRVNAAGTIHVSVNYDEGGIAKNTKLYSGNTYTGSVGGGWGIYNSAANTDYLIIENAPERSDYSLKMVANTKNLNTGRNNLGGSTSGSTGIGGKLVFEASMYMNSTGHKRELQFRSLNAPVPSTATTNVFVLTFDESGNIKGANNQIMAGYQAGTWYRLKLFVDNDAKKITYFVDDAYIGEATLPTGWLNIRHIYLYESFKNGVQGEWIIDDLKLSDYVPVTGLEVLPDSIQLQESESSILTASTIPEDASDRRMLWSAADPSVASVTYGTLLALKEGQTTVTVSTYEGNYQKTIPVSVIKPVALQSISLPSQITLAETTVKALEPVFQPDNAVNKKLIWSSSNPNAATVDSNGVITAVAAGSATIMAVSESNGTITASTNVTVTALIPVTSISLPNPPTVMTKYDSFKLSAVITPANATDSSLTWLSESPDVVSVDSIGNLKALKAGTARIVARSTNGIEASVLIEVVAPVPNDPLEYDKLRIRWKETLTGKANLDPAIESVKNIIDDRASVAQTYWSSMQFIDGSKTLWADVPSSVTDSAFVNTHYTRLRAMALAHETKGSHLYHNPALKEDIVRAMDWMLDNIYTDTGLEFGNWWNWDIGSPNRLADILILLYDHLTPQQILRNTASIDHYIGDITAPTFHHVGANRSDIMFIQTRLGLVEKNYDRLIQARDGLTPLFEYVTSGDGFYEDGSFIQHNIVPYTGSYGEVLIQGMGNLLLLLNGSSWEPVVPGLRNVYRWIEEGFAPVMYKGQIIDMTRGRAIVRGTRGDGYYSAKNILVGIARIAQSAPEDKAAELKAFIKHHMMYQLERGLTYYELPLDLADTIKAWVEDPTIVPLEVLPEHYEFNAMARSVHRGDGYLFGVSKSSKRIATYELTNGENPKGWYTGDGMTYLYNDDMSQYTENYWETIDWYRLPGTTVVVRPRHTDHYQYGDGESAAANSWAGGVTLGKYGISGMNLIQGGTQLKANKSWFAFDNEIVALGSGITSTDNKTVETIVEQRKLKADNSNELYVNGDLKTGLFNEEWLPNPNWLHLQGNVTGAETGYVFPGNQSLKLSRKEQTGRSSDINLSNPPSSTIPTELLKNHFMTLWLDHGSNPTNDSYEYAVLPNAGKDTTAAYASSPDYTVLANTEAVHAVRENKLGMTGFNFWKDEAVTVGGLTSTRKASVMLKENKYTGHYEMAVADPTLENQGFIELEWDKSATSVLSKDARIEIVQLAPTVKIKAHVKDTMGKSLLFAFQAEPVPDDVAPTWREGSAASLSDVTSTAATLSWTPAEDNLRVSAYRIQWGAQQSVTVSGDVYSLRMDGLSPDTNYSFEVKAGDQAGNWSAAALQVSGTTQAAPVDPGTNPGTPTVPGTNQDGDTGTETETPQTQPGTAAEQKAVMKVENDKAIIELGSSEKSVSVKASEIANITLQVVNKMARIVIAPEAVRQLLKASSKDGSKETVEVAVQPIVDSFALEGAKDPSAQTKRASQAVKIDVTLQSEGNRIGLTGSRCRLK